MKKNKLVIINLILISLLFLYFIIKPDNFITKTVRDGFNIINISINYIKEEIVKYAQISKTYDENKKLKIELENLKIKEKENVQLKKDIENLKNQLNLDNILSEYKRINANVISRNLGYWYDSIIIDKGSNDGIKKEQAVITSNGLIGYISSVNYKTSTVKLLTSKLENKISVKILNNDKEIFGLLTKFEDNYFIIEGITEKVEKDSIVLTTGLGNNYPEGLYIGKVDLIITDNFGLIKSIKIKTNINYDLINIVSVVIK